jgi:hypothetical protein
MAKSFLRRNAQINCYLDLCRMIGKCQHPEMCNDGGYMHFVPPKSTIMTHLSKRLKCCNQPLAEPCADCPNVLGNNVFSGEEGDDVPF